MNIIIRSEVTDINKQKFLAELERLLTFMYEEDKQQALDMYATMFDNAQDDYSLMQVLVSPTRQAVTIARAYDAKESYLQVQSSSREDEGIDADPELPRFVMAIDDVYQLAARKGIMDVQDRTATVLDDQLSLFADDAWPMEAEDEASEEIVEETPAPVETAEEPEAEASIQPELVDEVDAFLASFAIAEDQLVPAGEPEEEPIEESEKIAEEEADTAAQEVQTGIEAVIESPDAPAEAAVPTATVRKPRVFLLILYIIAAIPMAVAGISLLLIPTVLVGVLASAVILAGSASFVAAFSGFAVFADLLVVLGTALVISAVGLILLWLFIWFIGGAMVGLVRSIIDLGSRCCYKEVPVNG